MAPFSLHRISSGWRRRVKARAERRPVSGEESRVRRRVRISWVWGARWRIRPLDCQNRTLMAFSEAGVFIAVNVDTRLFICATISRIWD